MYSITADNTSNDFNESVLTINSTKHYLDKLNHFFTQVYCISGEECHPVLAPLSHWYK
jgi:hypothetical protein